MSDIIRNLIISTRGSLKGNRLESISQGQLINSFV